MTSLSVTPVVRPSWDQTWLQVAHVVKLRSRCTRDQVGAVIVDPNQRIVATAYNGPPAGLVDPGGQCVDFCTRALRGPSPDSLVNYNDCVSLHAEANALVVCDRSVRFGGTIYVTSGICFNCAKLVANSGLARVVVPHDLEHSYRSPNRSYEFLRECGLVVALL